MVRPPAVRPGHNGPDMAKVTLKSVAERVGVSRMTVSNAFSRPDQLSTELREKVLAAAAELGYSGPDPTARALARGRTGSVSLLLAHPLSAALTDPTFVEFVGTVSDELILAGWALSIVCPPERGRPGDLVADVAMDGAIVYMCGPTSTVLPQLQNRGIPFVTVDQPPTPEVASVTVDDRGGAVLAARHLLDLGHRRIDVLGILEDEPEERRPGSERLAGYLDVLRPVGIEPTVRYAHFLDPAEPYHLAREMLSSSDPPTALLCFSDVFALAAIRAAVDLGLEVPEDLSVVGYDDSPAASTSRPALTTVRQDVPAKARAAVEALIPMLGGAESGSSPRVELATELVVRASTAPPPAH